LLDIKALRFLLNFTSSSEQLSVVGNLKYWLHLILFLKIALFFGTSQLCGKPEILATPDCFKFEQVGLRSIPNLASWSPVYSKFGELVSGLFQVWRVGLRSIQSLIIELVSGDFHVEKL
jgi:hypothetical protein